MLIDLLAIELFKRFDLGVDEMGDLSAAGQGMLIKRLDVAPDLRRSLLSAVDFINYRPQFSRIAEWRWRVVFREDDGCFQVEERKVICDCMARSTPSTLVVTSPINLTVEGSRLGVELQCPTPSDLCSLESDNEMLTRFVTDSGDYWWNWREQLLFPLSLQFFILRLIEGGGGTYIAGPSEFINAIEECSLENAPADFPLWGERSMAA